MKFSTKEDIGTPVDAVFRAVSDFSAFEKAALRRGAQIQRVDHKASFEPQMAWDVKFRLHGRKRQMLAELAEIDEPNRIVFHSLSGGIEGEFVIDLVALSRTRTRLNMALDLKPKTLSARLMIQSLRLAKNKMTKQYKLRVTKFALDLEDRYKNGWLE